MISQLYNENMSRSPSYLGFKMDAVIAEYVRPQSQ